MRLKSAPSERNFDRLRDTYDDLMVRAMSMRETPDLLRAWTDDYERFADACGRQGVSVEDL
ncbi:hypothetical protein ACFJGV_15110 [Cnuibacter sp. UC19_7]|uniref:hypothetical protein n=1 Tax=Cnuibacter sp. UC19_7 TaxID=3350166 RepID=UPI003672E380